MQLLSQSDESALFTDMIRALAQKILIQNVTRALLLYEQRRHSARASDDSKVSVYLDVDPINIKDPIRLFVFAGNEVMMMVVVVMMMMMMMMMRFRGHRCTSGTSGSP